MMLIMALILKTNGLIKFWVEAYISLLETYIIGRYNIMCCIIPILIFKATMRILMQELTYVLMNMQNGDGFINSNIIILFSYMVYLLLTGHLYLTINKLKII